MLNPRSTASGFTQVAFQPLAEFRHGKTKSEVNQRDIEIHFHIEAPPRRIIDRDFARIEQINQANDDD
jgi:hypothetical protein